MECIAINGLVFDKESINAIEDIKRRNELFVTLSKVMTYGTLLIFLLGKVQALVVLKLLLTLSKQILKCLLKH